MPGHSFWIELGMLWLLSIPSSQTHPFAPPPPLPSQLPPPPKQQQQTQQKTKNKTIMKHSVKQPTNQEISWKEDNFWAGQPPPKTDLLRPHPVPLGWPQFLAGVGEGAVEAGAGQLAPWPLGVAAEVADKCLLPIQYVDWPNSPQTWLMVAVATPAKEIC